MIIFMPTALHLKGNIAKSRFYVSVWHLLFSSLFYTGSAPKLGPNSDLFEQTGLNLTTEKC